MSVNTSGQFSVYEDLKTLYAADDSVSALSLKEKLPASLERRISEYIRLKTACPILFFTPSYYKKEVLQGAVKQVAGYIFYFLDHGRRDDIAQKIWTSAGCPGGDDPKWGDRHAVDDVPFLLQLLHESLAQETPSFRRFDVSSPYEHLCQLHESSLHFVKEHSLYTLRYDIRQALFNQIWDLAGRPSQDNFSYGEFNVFDSIPRLQEAIYRIAMTQISLLSENGKNWIISQIPLSSLNGSEHNHYVPFLLTVMASSSPYLSVESKEVIDAWVAQGHLDHIEDGDREQIIEIMHWIELPPKYNRDKLIKLVNGLGKSLVHYWTLFREIEARAVTSSQISADSIPAHLLFPSGISREEQEFYQCEFKEYSNGRLFYGLRNVGSVQNATFESRGDIFYILKTLFKVHLTNRKSFEKTISLQDYVIENFALLDSCPQLLPRKVPLGVFVITQAVIDSISDFLEKQGNRLKLSEIETLRQANLHLFKTKLFDATARQNPSEALEEIWDQLTKLDEGETLLIPGNAAFHGFFFEIRRKEGIDIITIVNTGEDEENYARRGLLVDGKERHNFDSHKGYRYAHKAYQCKQGALTKEFIASILIDKVHNVKTGDLLIRIDQAIKDLGGYEISGRLHHAQGGPSCGYKRCTSWLKGWLIDELGEIQGNALYAQYKLFRTEAAGKAMYAFESQMEGGDRNNLKRLYSFYSDAEFEKSFGVRRERIHAIFEKRLEKFVYFTSLLRQQLMNSTATI